MLDRKPVFDALRAVLGRGFRQEEVDAIDAAFDRAAAAPCSVACRSPRPPSPRHRLSHEGMSLIKRWEGCHRPRSDGRFEAYPDPGSADGNPWTIGWGSTGRDIGRGTVWTQGQCDARFDQDIERYVAEVARAIGPASTSACQFDALVSFHYNTGAIFRATLTRLHKAGRFADARAEFGKWIYNDGKVMSGLRRRREEEACLYAGETGPALRSAPQPK